MVETAALIDLERRFWHGDAAFYDERLTADAVMVFPPPTGMLDRDAIVDALGGGDRWRSVAVSDDRVVEVGSDVALLVYRADAVRADDEGDYAAYVSSTYIREDGTWRLAAHQQTPIEE